MIKLRKARISESDEILNFYRNIISSIKDSEFRPKWNDRYPDLEFIRNSILKEELFVYSNDGIEASVVINSEQIEEYGNVKWHVDAGPDEIIMIHTFAVRSAGKGIGKGIFDYIVKKAIENNRKSIRLDVIDGNVGAQKVFEKLGFEYVGSVETFHEAVGLETFHLYENVLEKNK